VEGEYGKESNAPIDSVSSSISPRWASRTPSTTGRPLQVRLTGPGLPPSLPSSSPCALLPYHTPASPPSLRLSLSRLFLLTRFFHPSSPSVTPLSLSAAPGDTITKRFVIRSVRVASSNKYR